jgi:hypothetical protein
VLDQKRNGMLGNVGAMLHVELDQQGHVVEKHIKQIMFPNQIKHIIPPQSQIIEQDPLVVFEFRASKT